MGGEKSREKESKLEDMRAKLAPKPEANYLPERKENSRLQAESCDTGLNLNNKGELRSEYKR